VALHGEDDRIIVEGEMGPRKAADRSHRP
jgi:hypothetical protein